MDRQSSLEQLEGVVWGEPTFTSSLAQKCHVLRKVPIADLTIEDLRLLIGQGIGLQFLVPLALDALEHNPIVHGDMFSGDLLLNVASISDNFWQQFPELNNRLVEIKFDLLQLQETINQELIPAISKYAFK